MNRNDKKQTPPPDPGSALINPVTVAEMTAAYNQAARMVEEGYQLLHDAQKRLQAVYGNSQSFETIDHYHGKGQADIQKQLHRSAWKAIIEKTGIRKYLSIKRNEELAKRLESGDLPAVSDEEIITMIQALRENAPDFAKELALEVYDYFRPATHASNWEKSYVTNQRNGKYDLGKKVIMGWMIRQGYGSNPLQVSYGKEDQLFALDRIFALMDGQPTPTNAYKSPLVDAINTSPDGFGETEYFKFRACFNGNLHIEFKRADLLQQLNELAGNPTVLKGKKYKTKRGDHTTVNVPATPEAEAETFTEDFYWTPGPVIARMAELVPLPPPLLLASARILEPSAGEGHIADSLVTAGAPKDRITCIEKNPERARVLRRKGYTVQERDFLQYTERGWDLIYMNPPFGQEQDIRHVMHAYSLLASGGQLAAVMSSHDFYGSTKRCVEFREWFNRVGARAEKLPEKSFRVAGTDWDTRLVVIQKRVAA